MPKCSTPHCHREAAYRIHAGLLWSNVPEAADPGDAAPMCHPCYQALQEGYRRHPAEVRSEIINIQRVPREEGGLK